MQQGDVQLYQSLDGGEITVENGLIIMSGGLDTAVYLSLFGGNEDDNGQPDNILTWWGNLSENDKALKQISQTQFLLKSIPATSNNLRRINDAVINDTNWLIENKIASNIIVTVTIPDLNKVKITVDIIAVGIESNFEFVENWKIET